MAPARAAPDPDRVAPASGFSLHAGVAAEAGQREKLERLCRYTSRPAVAIERLSRCGSHRDAAFCTAAASPEHGEEALRSVGRADTETAMAAAARRSLHGNRGHRHAVRAAASRKRGGNAADAGGDGCGRVCSHPGFAARVNQCQADAGRRAGDEQIARVAYPRAILVRQSA
jgi:Putative transposase